MNAVEGGRRDVKVAACARRRRGEPSTPEGCHQRGLPAPEARSVVAAVARPDEFGRRVEAEALRLGLPLGEGLSALGDGAPWIWELAGDHFRGAAQALDFWHAEQRLAEAGRAALGEGPAFRAWLGGAGRPLAADGCAGAPLADPQARARLDAQAPGALGYFCANRGRLGYAARLWRGRAIGSGLVEGSIRQLVNLRMKRAGARGRVGHVGPFVGLVALAGSPEWDEHFASLAA